MLPSGELAAKEEEGGKVRSRCQRIGDAIRISEKTLSSMLLTPAWGPDSWKPVKAKKTVCLRG